MNGDRPRVVYDCNVFFQAFLTPQGPAFACVSLVLSHAAVLLLSRDILREVREVLSRPFVRQRFPHVTTERIDAFLRELAYLAEYHRTVPRAVMCERDPNDEAYLNLALCGAADYLVTRDDDLLSFRTSHSTDATRFRQACGHRIRIVTPQELLEAISAQP